jgi:fumarylacetoacetase
MSWAAPNDHPFSLQNLPYGVFSAPGKSPRCGSAIGDFVIDLTELAKAGLLQDIPGLNDPVGCFSSSTLNTFMSFERPVWQGVRGRLTDLLKQGGSDALQAIKESVMIPMDQVTMHLPAQIGDYTDYYSSREHATNVGIMFRGADNALQPNWLHLPVGYHGRASSVYVSGTDVVRPRGQLQKSADDPKQGSNYGPCRLLDYELEVAFFVGGPPLAPGAALSMDKAEDHIFGMVMMNDWSARDIQKWEYVPLGPFGAKNFATSISPWIVTLDALEPFRCQTSAGVQDPTPLPYLQDPNYGSYDIDLNVSIRPEGSDESFTVTTSNFRNLYWNVKQQLVHHAVTGCNMRPGDLLGSGTISGSTQESFGSLLELCWKGTREVKLGDKEVRKFLKDGDTVEMSGICPPRGDVGCVGFGSVNGKVLPAGAVAESQVVTSPQQSVVPRYTDFVLYGYWRSSCSWRVRVVLAAKGVQCKMVAVNLLQGNQLEGEHQERNPLKQVPVLECTDSLTGETIRLSQSMAIIDFLETVFPNGNTVYSLDAVTKARSKELAEMINSGIQPLQNLANVKALNGMSEGMGRTFGRQSIETGLIALELKAKQFRKPNGFLVDFAPTIADVCLVPQLFNARRFEVPLEKVCPTLLEIEALCAQHPWFVDAHPDKQPDAVPPAPVKRSAEEDDSNAKKPKA